MMQGRVLDGQGFEGCAGCGVVYRNVDDCEEVWGLWEDAQIKLSVTVQSWLNRFTTFNMSKSVI